jgi:hypothetical protein
VSEIKGWKLELSLSFSVDWMIRQNFRCHL